MPVTRVFATTALVGLLAVSPAVLVAQDNPVDINPEDVTIGQVVSFVNAFIVIERVRASYTTRIENAETEEERETLIKEADATAIAAVDAVIGITPDEYLGILAASQESEELSDRIVARIEELRAKQQGAQAEQEPEQSE